MTVATIIADLLRSIPAWLRQSFLVIFALCVVAEPLFRLFGADLPYGNIDQALLYVGGYLGVQSAANVSNPQPVDFPPADDDPDDPAA